jgi:hypothetical protein
VNKEIAPRDAATGGNEAHGRHRWIPLLLVFSMVGFAAAQTTAASASPVRVVTSLNAGSALEPGVSVVSPNHEYGLLLQHDGNLALYQHGRVIWVSHTTGRAGTVAELGRDGLFGVFEGRTALWETPAYSEHSTARFLLVRNDGNVVICNKRGAGLWSIDRPPTLQYGDQGAAVLALQRRLSSLGYWLGTPDGQFQDATQQAVWALQKAAGQSRDGVVGAAAWSALDLGVVPKIRAAAGNLIEVNLNSDLLMIIRHGMLRITLNTSTGGGYTYTSGGVTSVAITPQGVFHIYAAIDGVDVDSLGTLWRPRFFVGGFAIHGDSSVPPEPVSHGCVRVSDEAINWIWATNVAPFGSEVWVY